MARISECAQLYDLKYVEMAIKPQHNNKNMVKKNEHN